MKIAKAKSNADLAKTAQDRVADMINLPIQDNINTRIYPLQDT